MLNRFGIVCLGVGAIVLGVNSAFLPEVNADCSSLFGEDTLYGTGNGPRSVAVGDLDGDGDADLAVQNEWDDTVSILLNNGDGSFAGEVTYGTGEYPLFVVIGDLDGDGDADLAVVLGGSYPDFDGSVSVLLNNGAGVFAAEAAYGGGTGSRFVAIGDLDGDGDADLVVANQGAYPDYVDVSVAVLLGVGDGTFAAAVEYSAGDRPKSVAIGDLNGDQVPDLAVANGTSNDVSVLLGVGDGTFAADELYSVGVWPQSVAIGDLDGDGDADLAVANYLSNNVSVLLNNGDGTFPADVLYGTGVWAYSVAIDDLDGDGDADLVVANQSDGNLSVLLNNGDGTFAADVLHGAGEYPSSVAIGDLDGDGTPDLAVANNFDDNVSVLLNLCRAVCEGDANGDGLVDPLDAGFVLARFGCDVGAGDPSCDTADMNGDGLVDPLDVGYILARFGECP